MHSVRLESTKLILIGMRTTYQATGDAGCRRPNKKEPTAVIRIFFKDAKNKHLD